MGDFIKTLTSLIGSIKAKVDGKIGILQKRIDNIPTETVLYTPQTLTEEQQKQARDNIGANDDAGSMFVTITESTQNGTTVYSADKTYDEIVEAVKNGIVPVCNWIDPENTSTYGPQNIRCTYVSTFSFPGMIDFADFLSASDSSLYEVRIDRSNKVQIKYKLLGMTGATAYKDGTGGTVPMPYVGCQNKFLRGDATWADVPEYELPIAANEQLGGVKPVAKTDVMTQDVGVDENGKLYTEPTKDGVTPDIQIGTVTTLDAGSDATASMSGTAENPLLNLGIPKGADGAPGADYVLTDADKTEIAEDVIADGIEAQLGDEPLPAPDSASVGQFIRAKTVVGGKITETEATDVLVLPTVTTSNNGQFLRVVGGVWAAAEIQNANGEEF